MNLLRPLLTALVLVLAACALHADAKPEPPKEPFDPCTVNPNLPGCG
jgi:hypothetical protein